MLLPLTNQVQKIARLVILVKAGVKVEVQNQYMDSQIAAVWMKFGARGKKPLLLSGIYREHIYLFQETDISASDRSQLNRWNRFINSWTRAAANHNVVVIGDTNIDFLKWDSPDPTKLKLVELMKDEIEMAGFHQVVQGENQILARCPGFTD